MYQVCSLVHQECIRTRIRGIYTRTPGVVTHTHQMNLVTGCRDQAHLQRLRSYVMTHNAIFRALSSCRECTLEAGRQHQKRTPTKLFLSHDEGTRECSLETKQLPKYYTSQK
jgi:hypothetical protein